MNETTEGTGKYSNANLLDNNKVELQTEYATTANSFSEYDELSPLATILPTYSLVVDECFLSSPLKLPALELALWNWNAVEERSPRLAGNAEGARNKNNN